MYQREAEFYRDIAASVAIRSPRCFHADLDPENADFVLLLRAGGFSAGWPVVLEQFGDLLPDTARRLGDRMPDAVGRLLAEMCVERICVSHADVRLGNIFFDDARLTAGLDEPAVGLVDWQSVCTSSPEQDVAYFLTQSVPREVLAKEDLVAYYHGELTSHDVDYDLEDCRARYPGLGALPAELRGHDRGYPRPAERPGDRARTHSPRQLARGPRRARRLQPRLTPPRDAATPSGRNPRVASSSRRRRCSLRPPDTSRSPRS
jgi:hypothetical protein